MSEIELTRRTFLKQSGLFGLMGILPIHSGEFILRPPGATKDFLSKCIRCGKCLEACPYDSIRFLGITSGALVGTPYIDVLKTPCYLCQERGPDVKDRPISKYLRCGESCPTGAIRTIVNDKEVLANVPDEVKMGVSVLNTDICLAWQYDSCGECYYNCPLKDKAMKDRPPLDSFYSGSIKELVSGKLVSGATGLRPYVDQEYCIGCGMCNYVCPVNKRVAESVFRRDIKLSRFEERYAAMVRNVIGRAGKDVRLPAVRVTKLF